MCVLLNIFLCLSENVSLWYELLLIVPTVLELGECQGIEELGKNKNGNAYVQNACINENGGEKEKELVYGRGSWCRGG